MNDNTATISKGYGQLNPLSPASQKEARKQREAAARYRENPALELALKWRDSGDPRFDKLPAQTQVVAGYYANDKAAHAAEGRQS